ncbi:molybdopterin-dependent oxidoreductase [Opitutales bacterium ASA1]|uniref:molybdopterin-containing oxidoreductase family protein n=1 Tax=Congregicoccus parvus TaxID=3081749 RepID=UPI002B2C941A|nr:molybdopterin-dependent oxidoreductase [Opitutales bacterium ASA1]
MNSVSRRRFLKISLGSLAVAGASGGAVAALGRRRDASGTTEIRTIPTFCDICFWKCGAIASVRDGKLWKIEGNPLDPLSRGRLCPRGSGGIGAHFDNDRLRSPLIRVRERGEEVWKEVTWDEALDYIAERMQRIKAEHGPESMALFSHGIGGNFLKHTLRAYGSPNSAAPSFAQCRGPRDTGFELTFGDGLGSPERTDIENARCLVLIGSHLGENMHNTQVQEFATAVDRGASIIVADPRFSVAASKAKHYLPIRPGTDIALLLAWMNVLVTEELYDADYVAEHGHGFDEFAASIAEFTPEWAAPHTDLSAESIRETAREMARYRPATLVHPGRRVNWYGDDAQRSRAIALLNALLGSWGRKGGFYTPSIYPVPDYPYPPYPKVARDKVDNPGKRYPFANDAITTGIREATLTGEPYPIKGWMVYATNLLQALPSQEETIKAIQKLDLLVVIDVVPSEIAGWADVVLPECTYLERFEDLHVGPFKHPFIGIRQPVVDAPHDQKPNWWIAKRLAEKLGLGHYYPWDDIEDYLRFRIEDGGLDYEELKAKGILIGEDEPLYFEDGVPAEFDTPSGKIEFYSEQLAEAGFDPVPRYTPPDEGPPGSFRLLFGRSPVHTFSRTQTNPLLMDVMNENVLWLNHGVAKQMGLRSGDRVTLRNADGVATGPLPVKATNRIRHDCVYMVHGFGTTARGLTRAFGRGASTARMVTRYKTDPLMGGTAVNVNFVTLEKEA